MERVTTAAESSFDSDYCWDIDEQVEEDGQSSDDESLAMAVSLRQEEGSRSRPSRGDEPHGTTAVRSTMPPTILDRTVADSRPKAPQMGRSIEEQEFADEQAAGDVRMAVPRDGDAANEGMKNDPCLRRQGTRARKRIAGLWSKLRAIAYVASLQAYSQERQKAYNLLTMEFVASSEYDGEEHATSTMEKVRGQEDPAWLQGDMDMYSPANQKKRKRLKHDPAVQEKIKALWSLATCSGEGCGSEAEAFLLKGDFLEIMVKIHVLIIFPPVDLSWAMTNALKDWERDNAGLETMNLERFIDSIFELVDIWTETTNVEEYLEMLDLLTQGITKEIPRIGSLCWKTVEEIRYDPRITKVALTMNDIVDRGDEAVPESDPVSGTDGENGDAGLTKMKSFVQMKQASKVRGGGGKGDRQSFALGRWQKAVSVAMMVSKPGNSRELLQYIKHGKNNKLGHIKGEKLLLNIVKIYKAKEQVESKMRALEKDEGRLAPGRRRKHHRLDRFLLQFYIRQFGTKSLARKKLRQFVTSVSKEGLSHPRVTLFAKLSGIPIANDEGRHFRPFALTDYFLPIVRSLVPPGEDLDHWMGSGKEPAYVQRNVFIHAVLRILKSVPDHSKAMTAFIEQMNAVCDKTDQKRAQEQSQRPGKRPHQQAEKRESIAGMPGGAAVTANTRSPPGKDRLDRLDRLDRSLPKCARDNGHKTDKAGKRYMELDLALLAVVPLWEAEEAWRLWNHTITVAVLTRRWIRYCRGKKVQASSASTSSAIPVLKPTSPPGILPPVSSSNSPRVSPRSTEESRRVKAPGRKRSSQAYPEAVASAAERGPRVSPPAGARTEVLPSSEKNGTPRESSLFPTIGPT